MSTTAIQTDASATRRQDIQLIALVALGHGASHFCQLLLPPLFPWLKTEFQVSYTELGAVLTAFFVVSCISQAWSGFWVDRHGPRPVLFAGLATLVLATLMFALAPSYAMLLASAVVAGLGNGVFHPVNYTLLNRKVSQPMLGHAYSMHGMSGNLGWAAAPALVAPLALAFGWRAAMMGASALLLVVCALLWWQRAHLALEAMPPSDAAASGGSFGFLRIPAVWMCFTFFLLFAMVLSGVQAFAPEAARQLHAVPAAWVAQCLTTYMVCAACGMVVGGFLTHDPKRAERVLALGLGCAACVAMTLGFATLPAAAVLPLFGLMGLASGTASPARDMLVKQSTPPQSSGRVYGVVYSGLDIGQAIAPLLFGRLLDLQQPRAIWLGIAGLQACLIFSAFQVQRVRRTPNLNST